MKVERQIGTNQLIQFGKMVFRDCATLFQKAGWFNFFKRIKGFNTEVSYRFSQGFVKDTVTFDTLKFELTDKLIA